MATRMFRGRKVYGPYKGSAGGVAPGELLAEELAFRGISQSELARQMKRPARTVNELIQKKRALTADTALDIEGALGISAQLLLNLEAGYQLAQARSRRHAKAGSA